MSNSGSWLRAGRSQRLGFVGTFATAGVGASYGGQTRRLLHRQQQRFQKPPLIPSIWNLHSAQYVRAIAPLSALPLNPPARRKSHFFPLHQSYSANKPSAYSNRQCLQAFDQRRTFVSWFAEGKRKKKEEKKKKKERATTDFTSPSPSSSDEESPSDDMNARTVYAAMGANIVLTLAKFGGAWATGSASLLSEGVHSLGDCFNQGFLAIGIRNSKRKPDEEHPYGYGRETFIWALISACGVFFVGSGVTLYHGVSSLITGGALTSPSMALSILGLSFLLEGATFTMALRAVRAGATEAGLSMKEYLLRGSDPLAVAVLIEDGAAVAGVGVASLAVGLSHLTGNPIYDAIGSIGVGGILGVAAVFLIQKNRHLLLGGSVPLNRQNIIDMLESEKSIKAVRDVKAEVIGPGKLRFKAEIEFDGKAIAYTYLRQKYPDLRPVLANIKTTQDLEKWTVNCGAEIVDALGDEVDRLEREIQKQIPAAKHIDLESD